ncbi:MAG: hypothetical protein H0Z32_11585 [Bacillaceae bacterium]|nr:hypothetical protein [Bacillaceae bacterium]
MGKAGWKYGMIVGALTGALLTLAKKSDCQKAEVQNKLKAILAEYQQHPSRAVCHIRRGLNKADLCIEEILMTLDRLSKKLDEYSKR